MRKIILISIIGLSAFFSATIFAQTFFGSAEPNPTPVATPESATSSSNPMSPVDFQNQVRMLNQQKREDISKQLSAEIPPRGATSTATSTSSSSPSANIPEVPSTMSPTVTQPATTMQAQTPVQENNTVLSTPTSTSTTVTTQQTTTPISSQTYTGFSPPKPNTTSSGSTTTTTTNQPSWNIKY